MHCHINFEISILNGYITGSVSSDPGINNPEKLTFPKSVRKEARYASCDLSFGKKEKKRNQNTKSLNLKARKSRIPMEITRFGSLNWRL